MMEQQDDSWSFNDGREPEAPVREGVMYAVPEEHPRHEQLQAFIQKYGLREQKCLEIGSAGGCFQDMVVDYTGTDITESLTQFYHKPYSVAQDDRYPFEDQSFDVIWTIDTFEHILHLQQALLEIDRLLKPGGLVFFAVSWQCRSWAADGYDVRPYADFGFFGKLIKASIPLRDSVLWRALFTFPKRFFRHLRFLTGYKYTEIRYKRLRPRHKILWSPDAEACNHIDPHDVILWFESRGFVCLSHPMHVQAFLMQTGSLVFGKR